MPYIGKSLSVNYYRIVGKGGVITKKTRPEVEIWMRQLADKAKSSLLSQQCDEGALTLGPVVVQLFGKFCDDRAPDLHNLHKVIADALAVGLGINDKQIEFEDLGYSTGHSNPALELEIVRKR